MRRVTLVAASIAGLAFQASGKLEAQDVPASAVQSPARPGSAELGVKLNPDGSVVVPTFVMPFSSYASAEAKANFEYVLRSALDRSPARGPNRRESTESPSTLTRPWYEAQRSRYDVKMVETNIGGVGVQVFTPAGGVKSKNRNRVLINLHGGGFSSGWPFGSQIESIPISAVASIKVISVNYRMLPQHRFPAASEDVARVYRELLKTHRPSQIGIYGCSAGGILTGESIAWLQHVGLPMPAAIGIFSAYTVEPGGDSMFVSSRLGGMLPAPVGLTPPDLRTTGYWEGAKRGDPLATPSSSKAVLAKFPPTMLATGTRASDMSGATRSHLDLVKAGVDARLFLWDGVDHCFTYNPEMPESREAYQVTAEFFDEIMDKAERKTRR